MMTALVCLHVVGQLELADVSGFRTPESTVLDVRRRVLDVRAPQLANEPCPAVEECADLESYWSWRLSSGREGRS